MTIKLNAATGGGSVSLSAPNSTTSNLDVELTLPVDDGTAGQALTTNGSGTLSWASASSDSITEGNTTVECVDTGSDGHITFDTEGSERARFTSAGRFLIGGSTTHRATFDNGSNTCHVQLEGATGAGSSLALIGNANSTFFEQPRLILAKAQGSGLGSTGAMQNPSVIGEITFQGSDGTEFVEAARIRAVVDSTPGANDMPTNLSFWTTDDGASSPTERMRIDRNGALNCYHDTYGAQFRTNASAGTTYELMYLTYGATNVTNGTNCLRVYTNGNVQNANNSYGGFSDIKLKENIVDASSQWDDIKALQVRKYNFKEETGLPTHTQLGVVAQEAELISPGLVTESPEKGDVQIPVLDEDGNAVLDENGDQVFNTEIRDLGTTIKQVNYSVLYMKAVKALQEAMERIETLETANASLEARLTALEGGAS